MLSVRDIETKDFSRSKNGYTEQEVENFLDEIIVDYTALIEEKDSLSRKLIAMSDKLETIRDEQEARMQSLLTTQKSYDEVMAVAKQNAAKMASEAQQKADAILADAQRKASDILKTANDSAAALNEETSKKASELSREYEEKKAEYNALATEIDTLKAAALAVCTEFTAKMGDLPSLAKKELEKVTVYEKAPAEKIPPVIIEDEPEDDYTEEADGSTKVIPMVKETKVADLPSSVTREKINKALDIEDSSEEDYEGKSFYERKRGDRRKVDDRKEKIKDLFPDEDDEDDEEYDEEDEYFDELDEYEEDEPKKRSLFGFRSKKKSSRREEEFEDDEDDFDDDDDDDFDFDED